jgi:hypothetical protein
MIVEFLMLSLAIAVGLIVASFVAGLFKASATA